MKTLTPFLWFDGNVEEAVQAMMGMTKLDILGLERAYGAGEPAVDSGAERSS